MWPKQLAFRFHISCTIFIRSLTLTNTSSFPTLSIQLIFSIPSAYITMQIPCTSILKSKFFNNLLWLRSWLYFYYYYLFSLAQAGYGLLVHEVSWSYMTTPHSL
jgi:hypothetical protein